MRASEEVDRHIAIFTDYYRKRMGISNKKVPDIITAGIVLPEKEGSELKDDVYGKYFPAADLLYLNINEIPDYERLESTIVHELIHVKYPKLKHGLEFDHKIEEVLI